MDIIKFSEELQARMKGQMETTVATQPAELVLTAQLIAIIKDAIHDLEQFVYNYAFKNRQEEIHFFKEIKPVFVSQYLYQSKVFAIKLFDSYNELDSRKAFYDKVMKRLELFARRNKEFYVYIMSNSTYFDDRYFTRQNRSLFKASLFSTEMDDKLAKLLANELLKGYLRDALQKNPEAESHLKWTAPKTALIELGIALQAAGAFNNSNIDIKEIFTAFERIFKVNLKDHYRMFLQIKDRKKGQTTFLDQLKERLIQRINEEDEL
ncbi:MAG TPA: RteC domain-containing protein [Ohtaekwangia sp.]|nr:RteC domain-containing protein [Ohtaekwangia sp.]